MVQSFLVSLTLSTARIIADSGGGVKACSGLVQLRGNLLGNGTHFRASLGVGSFIPAFARCCFCIAASLLVFTSPMTSPLALLCQSCCVNGIADPVVPHFNTWQLSCRWAPTASIDYQRRPFKSLYRNIVYAPHDSFSYFM